MRRNVLAQLDDTRNLVLHQIHNQNFVIGCLVCTIDTITIQRHIGGLVVIGNSQFMYALFRRFKRCHFGQ